MTYAEVTAAQCDAHDVVLADPPYFEQCGSATKAASVFPRTASPVVAVGLLGARLLEAHEIAMAYDYI